MRNVVSTMCVTTLCVCRKDYICADVTYLLIRIHIHSSIRLMRLIFAPTSVAYRHARRFENQAFKIPVINILLRSDRMAGMCTHTRMRISIFHRVGINRRPEFAVDPYNHNMFQRDSINRP